MNDKITPHHIIDLPAGRRIMINMLELSNAEHIMYGLLEVDVTIARELIEQHKACSGETLSFTGYLTYCLARAVDEDKSVQVYLKGRKQLVQFDDVDVGLMIERQIGEKRALMGYVVRGANHKTYREIHQEIRAVQALPLPPDRGLPGWFRFAMLLPWPLSNLVKALIRAIMHRDPLIPVSMGGTVGISAVGMFGEGHSGWGIFPVTQGLGLVVGCVATKPAVVAGQIVPRQILNLTVVMDHYVVDGAPAARFARRLLELIESGAGLAEVQTQTLTNIEVQAAQSVQAFA